MFLKSSIPLRQQVMMYKEEVTSNVAFYDGLNEWNTIVL